LETSHRDRRGRHGRGAVAREMRRRAKANRMWSSFSRDTAREEGVELECEFEAVWKAAIENYEGGET